MSNVQPPRRGIGTPWIVVLSVVGALVLAAAFVGVSSLFMESEPSPSAEADRYGAQVTAICGGLDANPGANRYTLAVEAIPQAPGSGLPGAAESYRQAADIIDSWCPRHYQQSELLRGMARLYAHPGGWN